jgi:hypothetical protein
MKDFELNECVFSERNVEATKKTLMKGPAERKEKEEEEGKKEGKSEDVGMRLAPLLSYWCRAGVVGSRLD